MERGKARERGREKDRDREGERGRRRGRESVCERLMASKSTDSPASASCSTRVPGAHDCTWLFSVGSGDLYNIRFSDGLCLRD